MRNRGPGPVSCRTSWVLPSYALSVATGQSRLFGGKAGKKNSAIGFDWRDCFASFVGWKATPSGRYRLNFRCSWDRSADLDGLVSANNSTVL